MVARTWLAVAVFALAPCVAWAHSLSAESKQMGERVLVEAFFSDNTPAREARVEILDESKKVVASATTDNNGKCSLPAPNPGKYRLVVDAGAGHRHQQEMVIVGTLPPPETEPVATIPGAAPPPNESRRAELTRFPWERIAIGCGVIALLAGAWWLSRQHSHSYEKPS